MMTLTTDDLTYYGWLRRQIEWTEAFLNQAKVLLPMYTFDKEPNDELIQNYIDDAHATLVNIMTEIR